MPGVSVIGDTTTGHAGYPPTKMVTSPVTKPSLMGRNQVLKTKPVNFSPIAWVLQYTLKIYDTQ